MPMTLPPTEDAPRIPEADGQRRIKKVRWGKIRMEPASK